MNSTIQHFAECASVYLSDSVRETFTRGALFLLAKTGLRKTPVAVLRGPMRENGRSGTMLVAGHEPWVKYLPHRFFQNEPAREFIGHYTLQALPQVLQRLSAVVDLLVVRVDRQSAQQAFGKEYLRVPEWVGGRLQLPEDLERLVRSGGSIKSDMRLVRRHHYQPVVNQGAQDCDFFYHAIYCPFTQNRYGDMSFLRSLEDLRRRAARGGILWVQRDGRRMAALLYERKNEMLGIVALGTEKGNIHLEKEGAVAALYYFILKWARDIGCTTIDFRGSRPSPSDGLLRYKSKWGATLYEKTDSYYDLLVGWPQGNSAVTEFLSHTPLIFREAGGFSALLGNERQRECDVWVDGLRRCYYLKDWECRQAASGPLAQCSSGRGGATSFL